MMIVTCAPFAVAIGIHGSTNNESSVPGRGSEGCIRLRDDDLIQLKENYAFVGMKVVILPDEE
ncbi:MAG: L,D-transpeptidase [Prevotella sp.]|nr:L,D-transpeptidase [Prevotella sp.]